MSNEASFDLEVPNEPELKRPGRQGPASLHESKEKCLSGDLPTDVSKPKSVQFLDSGSIRESGSLDLIRQIKELRNEVSEMNQRVLETEEDLKIKDSEANELKELLMRLKDDHGLILETCEEGSSCKGCWVF